MTTEERAEQINEGILDIRANVYELMTELKQELAGLCCSDVPKGQKENHRKALKEQISTLSYGLDTTEEIAMNLSFCGLGIE